MAQIYQSDQRRDRRRTLPVLIVRIDDVEYRTRDWSLGGLSLAAADPLLPDGAEVDGHLLAEDDDTPHRFAGRVVRHDPVTDVVALRFAELAPEAFVFLERLQTTGRRRAGPTVREG